MNLSLIATGHRSWLQHRATLKVEPNRSLHLVCVFLFIFTVFSAEQLFIFDSSAANTINQLPKIWVDDNSSKSQRIVLRGRPWRAPRGAACAGFELWVCGVKTSCRVPQFAVEHHPRPHPPTHLRPYGKPECPLVARLGWPSWLKLFAWKQPAGGSSLFPEAVRGKSCWR